MYISYNTQKTMHEERVCDLLTNAQARQQNETMGAAQHTAQLLVTASSRLVSWLRAPRKQPHSPGLNPVQQRYWLHFRRM